MKTHHRFRCLSLTGGLLLALVLGTGCANSQAVDSTPPPESSAVLWPKVLAEVGDAACDSQTQCHSIGVGGKACGGPAGYMAWSSRRSHAERLQGLVERHAKAQRDEDQRRGMSSNCMVPLDPGASCVAAPGGGQCRLNSASVAAP